MIPVDCELLPEKVLKVLNAHFGFLANPHMENRKSAELTQELLAAQIETDGDKPLADALRADLQPKP